MIRVSEKYLQEIARQKSDGKANAQGVFFDIANHRDKSIRNGCVNVDATLDNGILKLREEL